MSKPHLTVAGFWALFDKNGPVHPVLGTRCWLWTRPLSGGKGRVRWNGKLWLVHRLSWVLTYGEPTKPFTCHHCDTSPCGNPEHLFEGTNDDNVADMIAKGRNLPSPGAFKSGYDPRRGPAWEPGHQYFSGRWN